MLLSKIPFRLTRFLTLPGLGVSSQTLTGALALVGLSEHILKLDAGASNRNLTLDAAASSQGRWYVVKNGGAANNILVKDGSITIATLIPGDAALVACDGSDWIVIATVSSKSPALAATSGFLSTEQTGIGAPQNIAHGLATTPALIFAIPSDLTGGVCAFVYGAHTSTNAIVTATTGEKYRVVAFK